VENAHDNHRPSVRVVEDAVTPVRQASERWRDIEVDPKRPCMRMSTQEIECVLKAFQISFGNLRAEAFDAEVENGCEIGGCCGAKPQFSHDARR